MEVEEKLKLGQHVYLMDKEFEEIRKTILKLKDDVFPYLKNISNKMKSKIYFQKLLERKFQNLSCYYLHFIAIMEKI